MSGKRQTFYRKIMFDKFNNRFYFFDHKTNKILFSISEKDKSFAIIKKQALSW